MLNHNPTLPTALRPHTPIPGNLIRQLDLIILSQLNPISVVSIIKRRIAKRIPVLLPTQLRSFAHAVTIGDFRVVGGHGARAGVGADGGPPATE
jgi:hypothetical protein